MPGGVRKLSPWDPTSITAARRCCWLPLPELGPGLMAGYEPRSGMGGAGMAHAQGGHDGQALAMQSPTPLLAGAFAGQTPSGTANAAAEVGRAPSRAMDLLRGTARVVEAAPEVDGHLHWGGVKPMRRVRFGCPGRSPTSWRLPDWPPPRSRRPAVHVTAGRAASLVEVGKTFFKPALRAAGLPEGLRLYDPAAHLRVVDRPGSERQGGPGPAGSRDRQHRP
jgi:hypothetical protein